MFTIEIDWDEVAITILDDTGAIEDVQFFLYEDIVYIRQWDERSRRFQVIHMSVEMFDQFRRSLSLPEGAYTYEVTRSGGSNNIKK